MTLRLVWAAVILAAITTGAQARIITCNDRGCSDWNAAPVQKPVPVKRQRVQRSEPRQAVAEQTAPFRSAEILPHPEGCPRTAFCGCGAAVQVFGRAVRELWLAANWLKFPPAVPGPGMVAVRAHHVMVIEAMLDDGRALVYDANSGGHQTRRWARSLAGYSIRDPHGAQLARAE